MFQGINIIRGASYDRGVQHGENVRELIDSNLKRFWTGVETCGLNKLELMRALKAFRACSA